MTDAISSGPVSVTITARVIAWFAEVQAPALSIRAGDVIRYAEFVDEIVARLEAVAVDHARNQRRAFERRWFRARPDHQKHVRVQLQIETFYLFSKILLDKLAHLVERFFGTARGFSLVSHDQLVKSIDDYLASKSLEPLSPRHRAMAAEMRRGISDFRDYQIAHEQSARPRSLTWSSNDPASAQIGFGSFTIGAVKSSTKQIASEPATELYRELIEYFDAWFSYMRDHATAYKMPRTEPHSRHGVRGENDGGV